jgi:sphingolipid delta-4 desaturase
MPELDYIRVSYHEPHAARGRRMLAAHPELRALAGPTAVSAVWTVGLVAIQLILAVALANQPWWLWLPCAYIVGATIDHALWALIHETTHNLVFRWRTGNRLVALVANIPLVAPSAMSFSKYHLIHHRNMGDMDLDAGVPGPTESRVVGRSGLMKTLWIAGYAIVQAVIRPRRLAIALLDGWTIVNIVFQVACMLLLVYAAGPGPLKYLATATVFAIGLHPLGARWIQEHFAMVPNQETYSYYGPLNKVSFNVGYHNEHHDIVTIPWSRLPQVRRIAPEFYEGLHAYHSWTALLLRFLTNPDITLFRYIIRPSRRESTEVATRT